MFLPGQHPSKGTSGLLLRASLLCAALAIFLPAALLLTLLLTQRQIEQDRLSNLLRAQAMSLAQAVEGRASSSMDALQTLAASDALQRGDVAGFFGGLLSMPSHIGRRPWQGVFLARPGGEILFNTQQPAGKSLGIFPNRGVIDQVVRTRQGTFTDQISSPTGQPATCILVPVLVQGKVRYLLGAWMPPDAWQALVQEHLRMQPVGSTEAAIMDGMDRAGGHPPSQDRGTFSIERDIVSDGHEEVWIPVRGMPWHVRMTTPLRQPPTQAYAALLSLLSISGLTMFARSWLSKESKVGDHEDDARRADGRSDLFEQQVVSWAQVAGHIGFFRYEVHTDMAVWTSGLARMLGTPRTASCEGSWTDLMSALAPQDRRLVVQQLRQALRQKQERLTVEARNKAAPPHARWLSCLILLVHGHDGRLHSIHGVVNDVSRQKALDEQQATLMERERIARFDAERANRAKDEFLAMLGHELRNPLGAISAACEVLNQGAANQDVMRRARQIITRQTAHLSRLMDDLLDVFRAISGKVLLVRERLQLGQVVHRVVHTLELAGALQAHSLSLDIDEVWVFADATRIEQVITNLLSNALKYTPVQGHITVRVKTSGSTAVLQVQDSGVGMTPELMRRVFDLFVQGERTIDRPQGGLGIGLTLVRRLTELHGGRVEVHSDGPDRGCLFSVFLPLAPALPPPAISSQPEPASKPRRIVVVEDNDDAREALCAMLTLNHHDTYAAPEGNSGLELILKVRPDAALIDIGLPGLSGYDIAHHLRAMGYAGCLIAISGYGQPSDVARARTEGFDEHLVKPIDALLLERLLNHAA